MQALPLLFIHGYPFTGDMWLPLVDLLEDRYRLIIPDLRGFGKSELWAPMTPGQTVPLSIALFADDLRLLIEEIGEDRPLVVVGLSMGGYIAFEFYRRFASNVMALVLADTRAQTDSPERKLERIQTAQRVLNEGSGFVADSMAQQVFASTAPAEMREHWRRIMSQTSPETIASTLVAMASRPDSVPTLRSILCPTLVIVGEADPITPLEDARRIYQSIPAARLEVIPKAAHFPPVERPNEFAQVLSRFVAHIAPRRPQERGLSSEPIAVGSSK